MIKERVITSEYTRGSGTWAHCRGCMLQRDRADRLSLQLQEEINRRKALELKQDIDLNYLALMRKKVDCLTILRIWFLFTRSQDDKSVTTRNQFLWRDMKEVRRLALWKWRAHTREQAWHAENHAVQEALEHQHQEVARLRETVYMLQENLTQVETSQFRMTNYMIKMNKRSLRRHALKAWVQAVAIAKRNMPAIQAHYATRWKLNALQREHFRSVQRWSLRIIRWREKLVLYRHFMTWRRRSALPVVLHHYRSQVEALQASMKLLHIETVSLRLFKDAVMTSDVKLVKKTGGLFPMEMFVKKIQDRVASAIVREALGTPVMNPELDQYGLGGVVAEMALTMERDEAEVAETRTPRGGQLRAERDEWGLMHVTYTPVNGSTVRTTVQSSGIALDKSVSMRSVKSGNTQSVKRAGSVGSRGRSIKTSQSIDPREWDDYNYNKSLSRRPSMTPSVAASQSLSMAAPSQPMQYSTGRSQSAMSMYSNGGSEMLARRNSESVRVSVESRVEWDSLTESELGEYTGSHHSQSHHSQHSHQTLPHSPSRLSRNIHFQSSEGKPGLSHDSYTSTNPDRQADGRYLRDSNRLSVDTDVYPSEEDPDQHAEYRDNSPADYRQHASNSPHSRPLMSQKTI